MPLEISEVFAMAPLARGYHPFEYQVPRNFNWGTGRVKELQEELVGQYERLHCETNTFLGAEGRAAFYGFDSFRATLAQSRDTIRGNRDAALKLMVSLYELGHKPLSPRKELDKDIARILDEPLLSSTARALGPKSPQHTRSEDVAEASRTAKTRADEARRGAGVCPLRIRIISSATMGKSTRGNSVMSVGAEGTSAKDTMLAARRPQHTRSEDVAEASRAAETRADEARRGAGVCPLRISGNSAMSVGAEGTSAKDAMLAARRPPQRTRSEDVAEASRAAETRADVARRGAGVCPLRTRIVSGNRCVMGKSILGNSVMSVGIEGTSGKDDMPAARRLLKPITSVPSTSHASTSRAKLNIRGKKSPVNTMSKEKNKSVLRITHANVRTPPLRIEPRTRAGSYKRSNYQATAARRPRFISRGALARARADAAWNARARAEANARDEEVAPRSCVVAAPRPRDEGAAKPKVGASGNVSGRSLAKSKNAKGN